MPSTLLPTLFHVQDKGQTITVTVTDPDGAAVDVAGATTKQIVLRTPSGEQRVRAASFVTDGTDGKLRYTLTKTDLTEPGWWRLWAYVELSGAHFATSKGGFLCSPTGNLDPHLVPVATELSGGTTGVFGLVAIYEAGAGWTSTSTPVYTPTLVEAALATEGGDLITTEGGDPLLLE